MEKTYPKRLAELAFALSEFLEIQIGWKDIKSVVRCDYRVHDMNPLLFCDDTGHFSVKMTDHDKMKVSNGNIAAVWYIANAKWSIGILNAIGRLTNYYQVEDIVKFRYSVKRYLKLMACRSFCLKFGYIPSQEKCKMCGLKCPMFTTERWDLEIIAEHSLSEKDSISLTSMRDQPSAMQQFAALLSDSFQVPIGTKQIVTEYSDNMFPDLIPEPGSPFLLQDKRGIFWVKINSRALYKIFLTIGAGGKNSVKRDIESTRWRLGKSDTYGSRFDEFRIKRCLKHDNCSNLWQTYGFFPYEKKCLSCLSGKCEIDPYNSSYGDYYEEALCNHFHGFTDSVLSDYIEFSLKDYVNAIIFARTTDSEPS